MTKISLTNKSVSWIFGIFSWILSLIILYYLLIYSQMRSTPIIKKRYGSLVILCNFIILFCISFSRVIISFEYVNIIDNKILISFGHISFSIGLHTFCYLHLVRYFLLYFDIKYIIINQQNKWFHFIDTTMHADDSFFIKYRNKCGKQSYMLKLVLIPVTISSGIALFAYYLKDFKAIILLNGILLTIPLIGFILIAIKIPTFHDQFLIKKELKIFIFFVIIQLLCFISYGVLSITVFNGNDYNGNSNIYFEFGFLLFSNILFFILSLLTTYWVLYVSNAFKAHMYRIKFSVKQMIKPPILSSRTDHCNIEYRQSTDYSTKFVFSRDKDKSASVLLDGYSHYTVQSYTPTKQMINLKTLLKNEYGFSAFMAHVQLEFSMEMLFAIIEMTQFSVFYGSKKAYIKLPKNIPQSSIVYNTNLSLFNKIKMLYNKYIKNGAEFELNLSVSIKRSLKYNLINIKNKSERKCSNIFNDIISECLDLLQESYQRFRETNAYKQLRLKVKDLEYDKDTLVMC